MSSSASDTDRMSENDITDKPPVANTDGIPPELTEPNRRLHVTFLDGSILQFNGGETTIEYTHSDSRTLKLPIYLAFNALSFIIELECSPDYRLTKTHRSPKMRYSFATNQLFTLIGSGNSTPAFDCKYLLSVTDSFLREASILDDGKTYYTTIIIDRKAFMVWSLFHLFTEGSLPWRCDHPRADQYITELKSNVTRFEITQDECLVHMVISDDDAGQFRGYGRTHITGHDDIFLAGIVCFCDRLGLREQLLYIVNYMKDTTFPVLS